MTRTLFGKYAAVMMALVGAALIAAGLMEGYFNYRDTRRQVELLQGVEARAAAARIEQHLRSLEAQVRDVARLPWDEPFDLADRRDEYRRLLRVAPAILELRGVDPLGRERLKVSRIDLDAMDSGAEIGAAHEAYEAARRDGVGYGPTYFRDGSEPYLTLALRDEGPAGWVTLAEVNLKFVGDFIRGIAFGQEGRAYVIDARDHLVAHPNVTHVLRRQDVGSLPQVRLLREHAAGPAGATATSATSTTGRSLDNQPVLATFAPVGMAGWWVFVEQPRREAFAPVAAALLRTLAMFAAAALVALAAAWYLARRLARPVLVVQRGAARLAAGRLDTRIHLRTGDEVEALAYEFNHMAAQLEGLYEDLERRVALKTAELEAANRHKSEFVANMSHELRTPLNAVIGFSEALQEQMFGRLNPKQMEYVRDIHGSGQHLLSLINDILDLAKVEAGRMELDVREFDVGAALENCCVLVRERMQRHGLALRCEVAPAVGAWRADERKFKQVVLNLLSNAAKFTPSGGSVSIDAQVAGDGLAVSVSDTGIGIDPADHEAIFGEFTQLRAARARHEGTGLGLALSRRLVALHGGTLEVASEPGRGSRFTARFPATAAA